MKFVGFILMRRSPDLTRKRLDIRNEEQVLEAGLMGYAEYKKRVRYKVIPFVW